jgi:hypothetical protein
VLGEDFSIDQADATADQASDLVAQLHAAAFWLPAAQPATKP